MQRGVGHWNNVLRAFMALCGVACGARGDAPAAPVPAPAADDDDGEATPPASAAAIDEAASEGEEPPPPAATTIPDLLADDHRQRFDRRAVVLSFGAASIGADEAPRDHSPMDRTGEREVVVIDERGPRVRVVDELYNLRAALWIARDDLGERVVDAVALAAAPGQAAAPGGPGAVALGGAAPTIDERQGEWARVTIAEAGAQASGWLPASAIDRIYRAPRGLDAIPTDLALRTDAEVLDTFGGRVLASLDADDPPLLRALGPARRGLREIEAHTAHLEIRGLVPAAAVKPVKPGGFVLGGVAGGGWGRTHTNWIEVPAGTLVHAAAGGEAFAVTTRATGLAARSARRGAWFEVDVMTAWGGVDGWIVCPALRRSEGGGARFTCTSVDDPERVERLPSW